MELVIRYLPLNSMILIVIKWLRYDFYNSRHQHEPLWYNYWLKRFVVVKWSWIYGLWRLMLIDVIGWSLKIIEVYIESNRKEMDDGVKEGEKGWKIATIQ